MKRRHFIQKGTLAAVALPVKSLTPLDFLYPKGFQSKIKIGLIGCGVRGTYLLKIVQEQINNAEVVACCDILESNLQRAMGLLSSEAEGHKDYKAILNSSEIEAVIIATPLHLHFAMAMEAIDAGKHIYCEKTMCYNIPQSLELYHKVKSSPNTFQVGYQQRSNLLLHKIKDLIKNGWCGEITHIDCAWNRNGDWRRRVKDPELDKLINWRMYKEFSGGLTTELCSHQIDMVNYLIEAHPEKVTGFGGIDYYKDGRETFDNVNIIFEYPKGLKAKFSALTTNSHEGFYVKLYGTKATIEVTRKNGQEAFIFPERPPDTSMNMHVDGVTGATMEAWDRQEGIPIKTAGATDDETATKMALEGFLNCVLKGNRPTADVLSGYLTSVSTHMANAAMSNERIEYWKEVYNVI
ncbi:Gfo/Idh/MocA family oxidoreductase [uncultured Cyclobacterium sp.]|uniref:Gfo/Idh/MocA family protein n=1 Tax=uncultured Cyclobacterium sp. TaxID=453820 RepID=UPI0030EF125F|tara:strand:+ start:8493 stop:9716 length:1224 start_codon:yes stop_codon:yes gene_type:complete